jgi:signal transduction histidine kinase
MAGYHDGSQAPSASPQADAGHDHLVQFYESESALTDLVVRFARAGLNAGEPLVVIATEGRCAALAGHLREAGLDVDAAEAVGLIAMRTADASLASFMVDDVPDADLFRASIVPLLQAALAGGAQRVRVYGEMVDVLCRAGRPAAALRLEELWNELGATQPMRLLCAYSLEHLNRASDAAHVASICAQHGHVVPAEGYAALGTDDARRREIVMLQQRAAALEAEVQTRRSLEQALRAALAEHDRTAAALARARDEAERANRAKTDFLAVMSHELRTPLNAIIGYDELLALGLGGPLTPSQEGFVGRIRTAAEQLLGLVDQILSLTRIEAGKEAVIAETVDVAELVTSACALVEPDVLLKGLTLHVDAATPIVCETDASKVRQIVLNLLSNAVKFTAEGRISVHVRATPDGARIEVADTGVGIAPADQRRVFDAFVQVDSGRTRKEGGTGLGLAVSRDLARMLGGDIALDSEAGRGSRFTVRVPARPPVAAVWIEGGAAAGPASGAGAGGASRQAGPRAGGRPIVGRQVR